MVYPVGETAKLPDLVKNIREEDVPERFRAELRGVPESLLYRRTVRPLIAALAVPGPSSDSASSSH